MLPPVGHDLDDVDAFVDELGQARHAVHALGHAAQEMAVSPGAR